MFQVASRPTAPHLASAPDMYTLPSNHPSMAPPSLQLPRKLARPSFSEVSSATIAALEPELGDVPIEYIRKTLAGQASQMLSALSSLSIPSSLPRARLPPTIDVPIRPTPNPPSPSSFPTHILAISSSRSSPSVPSTPTVASFSMTNSASLSATVPLQPTHALVLAAYCTLLPPLPRSRPSNRTANVSLPIVPITVPSAETFHLLHAYLHTRRPDTLLAALLPSLAQYVPGAGQASSSTAGRSAYVAQFTSESLLRLANVLASSAAAQAGPQGPMPGLMAHAKTINGVWRNACALGVFDTELWGVMDLAWEVVLVALTRAAERERS